MQIDDEVYEEFASEARERLAAIEEVLLGMESSENQTEDIKSIFRDIHTIKGNSHFLGIENIKTLSHVFEDMFGKLRNGEIQLSHGLIDVSIESVDLLRRMLNDKTVSISCPDELLQRMKDIEEGKQTSPPPAPKKPQEKAPAAKIEPPAQEKVEELPSGGAMRVFEIEPFGIIYLKLYRNLDEKAGKALSNMIFDSCQDGKTFILDASYVIAVDESTEQILGRTINEIDIFNSKVLLVNATKSFRDSVCSDEGLLVANSGEAVARLLGKAA